MRNAGVGEYIFEISSLRVKARKDSFGFSSNRVSVEVQVLLALF